MLTYQSAGVDIESGNRLVNYLVKKAPEIGGFSGRFPFGNHYLVAGTDGVGTKLKLAFAQDSHTTVGIDLVAMCVNDLLTCGATPHFFLDYFATGKLNEEQAKGVLEGIIRGCEMAGTPLIGGETAEMPGMYQEGEYDLAGFCVGSVLKEDYIDGSLIQEGDRLFALPSSGFHSNGFSLIRQVLEKEKVPFNSPLGKELLTPTRIYVKEVKAALSKAMVKGMAHITGGGLVENVSRVLKGGLTFKFDQSSCQVPEIFKTIQQMGNLAEDEMWRTFNMGIGYVFILPPEEREALKEVLPETFEIGKVVAI